ncbi:transporter [Rhodoblastus sp.]|jgi:hypothetical protein|uniref:transporter n=1 Tax=Rhodoblastus sp. TaxID=1962975 RepID=UPI0025CFB0F7|nr:transporter [Rhodoblastus sp.]
MDSKRLASFGSVGFFLLSLSVQPGRADDAAPAVDKSSYNLLNPTPPDAMRAFAPERPTKILNPFTVDAGHFQVEGDLLNYVRTNDEGLKTQSFQTADPTIKLGITSWMDFELVLNAYQTLTTRNNRTGEIFASARGFGDTILKAKINLVGNDGGTFAAAIVPCVKLPSAAPGLGNGVVEGGVALPVQISLPGDFALGLQTEVDALKDANDTRRYANFVNIANLSHTVPFISKDLTASIEFFSSVGTDSYTPAVYTFDVGLAYLVLPNVQLDAGANFGLTKSSPDLNLYTGVTARF